MRRDTRLGVLLMAATTLVFASQDALSRHLAEAANVPMVVMIRFWVFAALALAFARARAGSLRAALRSRAPGLQTLRGVLLAAEVCVMVAGFTLLGLIEAHAIFAISPLLVVALSGPLLGERVGWRRWAAVGVGFAGILVILRPGAGVFDPAAAVPLIAAAMWAGYGLLTRRVARDDSAATSFLWTGVVAALAMTPFGLWFWEPMGGRDWALMAALCVLAMAGHGLLIKAYEVAEASAVQPFAYLQLVFAAAIGMAVFGEALEPWVAAGAAIVVAAGVFALWRERVATQGGRR